MQSTLQSTPTQQSIMTSGIQQNQPMGSQPSNPVSLHVGATQPTNTGVVAQQPISHDHQQSMVIQGQSNVIAHMPSDTLKNIGNPTATDASSTGMSNVPHSDNSQSSGIWHFTMDQVLHLVSHAQTGALNNLSNADIQKILAKEVPHTDGQNANQATSASVIQVGTDQVSQAISQQLVQQPSAGQDTTLPTTLPHIAITQQTQDVNLITPDDVQHLFNLLQTDNLSSLTLHQLQQLNYQIQCGNFGHLSPEQMQQLHIVAQALNISKTTVGTDVQGQQPQFDFSQISADQMRELQAQTQALSSAVSNQNVPTTNDPNLWKVSCTKSDGSNKDFFVNDPNGQHISSFCEQVDISGQCIQNQSSMVMPPPVQRFPAHTLRHVDPSQLHQFNQSQHSDTSSSLASGTPSLRSGGSAGHSSTLGGSGSTS